MRKRELEKVRRLLEERLLQLEAACDEDARQALSRERRPFPDKFDWAKLIQDESCEALTIQQRVALIYEIKEVLVRIRLGKYGVCEWCEGDIPSARLKVMPFTTVCVVCREEVEVMESKYRDLGEEFILEELYYDGDVSSGT